MKKIGTLNGTPVYATDVPPITASGRGGGIEGELADKVKRTPGAVIVLTRDQARELLNDAAAMARRGRPSRFTPTPSAEDLGA
jgi:hypothetical protein